MKLKRKTFSKDKSTNNEDIKGAAMLAGGGAMALKGADVVGKKLNKRANEKFLNSKVTAKDAKEVEEKLLQNAKKQGIKVIRDPHYNNSVYTGDKIGKHLRDGVAAYAKKLRKQGHGDKAKKLLDGIKLSSKFKQGSDSAWKNLGKDSVIVGAFKGPDVLSHELGHAQYMKSGRSKSVVGKAAHKLMPLSKAVMTKPGMALSVAHGFKAGVDNERNKQNGKKSSSWDKVKSVAVPAALAAPLLIAEGKASLNGLKQLKKSGASKELMKQSKKRLGAAWSTYVTDASRPIIAGGAGDVAGRGFAKLTRKREKGE